MQRLSAIILILLTSIVISACQQRLTPDEVATLYWQAIKDKNHKNLQEITLNYDKDASLKATENLAISQFSIIRTIIEKDRSIVETQLEFNQRLPGIKTVETVLVKQDDTWLVDQQSTLAELQGNNDMNAAIAAVRKFTQSFSKDLDHSLNELERQAPTIRNELEGMVKKFSDRLPALQKELEGFANGLNKALEPLANPSAPTKPPAITPPPATKSKPKAPALTDT